MGTECGWDAVRVDSLLHLLFVGCFRWGVHVGRWVTGVGDWRGQLVACGDDVLFGAVIGCLFEDTLERCLCDVTI